METKRCTRCDQTKPLSGYYTHRTGAASGKPFSACKQCENKKRASFRIKHPEHHIKPPNPKCSQYLGIYIAERALSKFFDHVIKMPTNNPGYDFICGKGFKIDAKSSCLHKRSARSDWEFSINRNSIADYFLCLGFDNRHSLEPLHVWLIPGEVINTKINLGISNSNKTLAKWSKYERSLDRVIACCAEIRAAND